MNVMLRGGRSIGLRALSSAAPHAAGSVGGILASASAAVPLKDAVKFYRGSDSTVWSYSDLERHVGALSSGLQALGYGEGDRIASLLPSGTPEYNTLILAVADIGATLVSVPLPSDPSSLEVSLRDSGARMLIYDQERVSSGESEEWREWFKASASSLAESGAGVAKFPALEHVVHAGAANVPGVVKYRSLLAYDGRSQSRGLGDAVLFESDDGSKSSASQVVAEAQKVGEKLGLSADRLTKTGKLVVDPSKKKMAPAGIMAALIHESLLISPGEGAEVNEIVEVEDSLLLN